MTDEPPESQPPWPDDQRQPYRRRHASDDDGFYAPGQRGQPADPGEAMTQQLYQPSQVGDYGAAQPWTQPGYDQPPHQLMGPLFESGSNYGEFRSSETMTHWRPPNPRRRKILLFTAYAAAAVAVAVVAGVVVSISAKPARPAASTSSASAAVPPAAAPSATPAPSSATSDVNGVLSWWASYGIPTSQQIGETMAQLKTDATSAETTDDLSAVEADLTTAEGEIQAAQADPPIPDATLEQLWSTALADYGSGISEMLAGFQNNLDVSEIDQGAAEAIDGNTPMTALVSDINSLG
jgi:hypothetical protein